MRFVKYFIVAVLLTASTALWGQASSSDALSFTREDYSPVLAGTAGAAVASVNTAPWAAFRSAAVAPFSFNETMVAASYSVRGEYTDVAAAFTSVTDDVYSFSLGAAYRMGAEIAGYKVNDITIAGGAAYKFGDYFSVGANARYARQNLTEQVGYNGLSADLSLYTRPASWLSIIAGASTFGTAVTSASGSTYSQPAFAYAGAGVELDFYPYGTLGIDASADYYLSGQFAAAGGLRYEYGEWIHVSAGYRYAKNACVYPSCIAAGVGFTFEHIGIDLTYRRLAGENLLGASVCFVF